MASLFNELRRPVSLARSLATTFVVLSGLSLLLLTFFQAVLNFQTQRGVAAAQQQVISLEVADEVNSFIEQNFSTLETASVVGRPLTGNAGERQLLLESLLAVRPAFRETALLNSRGQEVTKQSRLEVITPDDLLDRADSDLFNQINRGQRYIGPVRVDEVTNEPIVSIAIPVENPFGVIQGALVADVNLKFLWDLVDKLKIGENGLAYVVDKQGNLIAFGDDSARVLRGENVSSLAEVAEFIDSQASIDETGAGISRGVNGDLIVGTYVPLGTLDWAVVTELPVTEAYRGVIGTIVASLTILIVVVVLAGFAGIVVSRRLTFPLLKLTETATRIAEGEPGLEAGVEGPLEVTRLAGAFNSMTRQMQELIGTLEQRIASRTKRLETVAVLSERLSAILDFDQLLNELVNQVKDRFGYYHAHVYIIDEDQRSLVMTAGAGEAGATMKAAGHQIPLDTPNSLVARAARTGQIVREDNVREVDDWLPNPLLPDTYAEMAVPIILGEQVVGILDVQEDRIAGLDEGDTSLLRSLANQVAVAIRNARLFAEVEAALAEAQATQERYISQAWSKSEVAQHNVEYIYQRPGAPTLAQTVTTQLDREATAMDKLTVVRVDALAQEDTVHPEQLPLEEANDEAADPDADRRKVIVAPIRLQNQTIGTIQLVEAEADRQWNELELALVQAVTDRVAQAAENLRLFNEARERGNREQAIREVTDQLRAASSLDSLLEIAARELGQRLGVRHTVMELGVEPELQLDGQNGKHTPGLEEQDGTGSG
ncbi:MAG: cache domain-containing protein [Anaerolineae bacterium]|nr:cache domain-containing protein [Anaerolineae bacterium]